jgi:hypothetical protein
MKRILVGIAIAAMATALVSCGGGGGGGGTAAGLSVTQSSPSPIDTSALIQPNNSKAEATTASQELAAQQAEQGGGLASLRAQGPEGLKLIRQSIAQGSDILPGRQRLFAYLPNLLKIASIPNTNPAPGESVAVDLIFPYFIDTGGYKNGVYASNLAYDARRDRLYVPVNNGAIGILKNASAAKGEVQIPIYYAPTSLDILGSVSLDAENDTLWLVGSTSSFSSTHPYTTIVKIKSISNIESRIRMTIQGKRILPSMFITVWHVSSSTFPGGFAIDAKQATIYMDNGNVFDLNAIAPTPGVGDSADYYLFPINEAKARETLPVRRFVDGGWLLGIALDVARDRLYAVNGPKTQLLIVENASANTSPAIPIVLNLPGPVATYSSLTFDAKNDRLYIGGAGNDGYIINNASTINTGSTVPAAYAFAAPDLAQTRTEVWGIAFPQ